MPAPILATKLYIPPPRAKIVLRPRLIERLNEGLSASRKLTLISAPAGFGKTTLVSEWIASYGRPVAWLSLDEGDNDLTRFLTYLLAALQTIGANLGGGALAALQSPQPPSTESLLTTLLNEIATVPKNFILVLDDYHAIDSKPVDEALTFLLEHLPSQMHLVIATREDPHLPLARLRARGQLTEVRAADLRFTPSEAADFLNRAMGLNLSTKDITALETRTEGWIAGLQLAAISMQGHQDAASFIQSFTGSHHFVLDYLVEEVLQQQPESVQTFLLQTSILDRLCGPLCDAVLLDSSAAGQETLEYLERANLFIVPLDNERRWYRYHNLFGDLLRQRLGKPNEFAEFHLRASQWHEENGDPGAAFHHAIAAGDFIRAAEMAEAAYQGMDGSFQSAAWQGWVKKLPEEVIRVRPVLCIQLGGALTDAGEPEASELRLQDAERCLDGSDAANEAQLKPLPAMIALAHAFNAQVQGDLSAAVKYAELALELLPADNFFRRAQATMTLEFTQWASGNLDSALQAMEHWMNSMQKAGNLVFVVASAFAAADIQVAQGALREAEKTYLDAIELAASQGPEVEPVTAHHHLGLALIYHEMDDRSTALHHFQRAGELGERTTLVDWPYRWNVAQAWFKESEGELDAAIELLDEARRVYAKNPVPDLRPIEALKVQTYLKQGRLDKAQAWVREGGLSTEDDVSYLREFEYLTFARVLMAEGEHAWAGVNGLLERLLHAAERQKRMGDALEILVVQALAHRAQGDLPLALASLERALTLAEPEGYVRIFVDEGEPMRMLIADPGPSIEKQISSSAHTQPGYTGKLLAAFAPPAAKQSTTPALAADASVKNPKSEMQERLSQRELEIIKLIAQGLSNREISARLFLALDTVKGHNRRIFDKLEVQSRTEAIARAHELGLL